MNPVLLLLGGIGLLALTSKRAASAPEIYEPGTGERRPALPPPAVDQRPSAPRAPEVYDPGTGERRPALPPPAVDQRPSAPRDEQPPSLPAIPSTPTSTTSAKPRADAPVEPPTMIPQPKGATGNLPNITRPLARQGFNPEQAHKMAPQVYAQVLKGPVPATRTIVRQFQVAADLMPRDGVYGPRTAGALEYYLARPGGAAPPKTPLPHTKDKRIIPYAL